MEYKVWEDTTNNTQALTWFTKMIEDLDFLGFLKNGFVNFFYGDLDLPLDTIRNRQIIMGFLTHNLNLQWTLKELSKNNLNISAIYYKNEGNLCCIVFDVPEEWHEYYDLVVLGQFSKIPYNFVSKELLSSEYEAIRNIIKRTPAGHQFASKYYGVDIPEDGEYWSKPSEKNFL